VTEIEHIDQSGTAAVILTLSADPATTPLTAVQIALYAGWTMAVLDGLDRDPISPTGPPELPTVPELPGPQRLLVELGRLRRLVECLAKLPGCADLSTSALAAQADDPVPARPAASPPAPAPPADFKTRLRDFHLSLLKALAAAGLELELAYELGRSLRYTVDPPTDSQHKGAQALAWQFDRARIAKLQGWLAALAAGFPSQEVATIVSASLGRWSDFAALTVGTPSTTPRIGQKDDFVKQMEDYLLRQGDIWLMFLVGVRSTAGLVSPEGYVSAGEAALRRSARIVRGVLAHYWGALFVLAAALGGATSARGCRGRRQGLGHHYLAACQPEPWQGAEPAEVRHLQVSRTGSFLRSPDQRQFGVLG
jgi:hypothetical protein